MYDFLSIFGVSVVLINMFFKTEMIGAPNFLWYPNEKIWLYGFEDTAKGRVSQYQYVLIGIKMIKRMDLGVRQGNSLNTIDT